MRSASLFIAGIALAFLAGCAATDTRATMKLAGFPESDPVASAASATAQPVDPARDIVNIEVARALTPGMMVEIHVAPRTLEITHAGMMLVRREPRGQDVALAARSGWAPADWIVVQAMAGGMLVSQTAISDTGVDASESAAGDITIPDRTFLATFPTPRRVDTVVLTSTTTGQVVEVDVTRIMSEYCASNPAAAPCRVQ